MKTTGINLVYLLPSEGALAVCVEQIKYRTLVKDTTEKTFTFLEFKIQLLM